MGQVTADRVKEHFGDRVKGPVERFELPNLRALNFLCHQALGGGGTVAADGRAGEDVRRGAARARSRDPVGLRILPHVSGGVLSTRSRFAASIRQLRIP